MKNDFVKVWVLLLGAVAGSGWSAVKAYQTWRDEYDTIPVVYITCFLAFNVTAHILSKTISLIQVTSRLNRRKK